MDLADIVKYNIAYTKQLKQTEAKPLQTSPSYLKYILDKQGGTMNEEEKRIYKAAYAAESGKLNAEADFYNDDERSNKFHDRAHVRVNLTENWCRKKPGDG